MFTQTTLAVSQLTQIEHENSHLQSARTFQTMLGAAQSARKGSLNPSFPELVLQQVHRAPDTIFARLVRGEIKPGLHTVCVRKPSDFALLRVRGPNRRINSHGSTCSDSNLFLAEFTKRGRYDNQESGTQHQQRIQHDTTRDATPGEER